MSQTKITLRPPPNVEFVQGYPGIPPAAPDRPQAAVKGTIELRLGSQGAKAKWVRIELKKVETLPGGGQANTFYDFVGQSPVSIWQAQDEWSMLYTQDFPFYIRIPESIPPTLALERGAGIRYELIATVCMKGKKGFLRRSSSPESTTSAPVIIDKHELHATWPIYGQPESRDVASDSLTLTVNRTHTCYGPGDRVSVLAILKSDNLSTVVLRAFEFALKETVIYRSGSSRSGAPQVKVIVIGEQKVPVNATIFGGTQHKAELACIIPSTHTNCTVNTARHIDIAYIIQVKAVLATGKPLIKDLPVTISNWSRSVSMEAVRRIGPSPNLSLISSAHLHNTGLPQHVQRPGSAGQGNSYFSQGHFPNTSYQMPNYHTIPGARVPSTPSYPYMTPERSMPNSGQGDLGPGGNVISSQHGDIKNALLAGVVSASNQFGVDELGYHLPNGAMPPPQSSRSATFAGHSVVQTSTRPSSHDVVDMPPPIVSLSNTNGLRPRSTTGTNSANRFTVANMVGDLEEVEEVQPESSSAQTYPTAAEEKKQIQQSLGSNAAEPIEPSPNAQAVNLVRRPTDTLRGGTPWPTAEEEKQRLFNKARADAERIQISMGRSISSQSSAQPHAVHEDAGRILVSEVGNIPQPSGSTWFTAEDEKLRLFDEAQAAARRTQARAGNSPSSSSVFPGHGQSDSITSNSPKPSGQSANPDLGPHASAGLPLVLDGAKLYSQAMSSLNRTASARNASIQPSSTATSPALRHSQHPHPVTRSRFPTAEEEKAALRYYEAKRAVDRHQNEDIDQEASSDMPREDPISYDTLYPSANTAIGQGSSQASTSRPILPSQSTVQSSGEREDVPQTYNAHHAMSTNQTAGIDSSFLHYATPPTSPPSPPTLADFQDNNVLSEKERLRRRYESQDLAALNQVALPALAQSTMPVGPPTYARLPTRSQPVPPTDSVGVRQLTAAEEKAKLRALYEAEEAAVNSNTLGRSSSIGITSRTTSSSTDAGLPHNLPSRDPSVSLGKLRDSTSPTSPIPPIPPPLMPRPPMEYIRETQEEDARTQAEENVLFKAGTELMGSKTPRERDTSITDFGLNFRPFSPLDLSLGLDTIRMGGSSPSQTQSPPPLPPKIPVTE